MNKVSNLPWSCAVMKERRILGILLPALSAGFGFDGDAVWKEAAISWKPVGCGFCVGGGGAIVGCWLAGEYAFCGCCCCSWNCCGMDGTGGWLCWPENPVYWGTSPGWVC